MPEGRYVLWGLHVLDQAKEHGSDELKQVLADVLDLLEQDPYNHSPRTALSITAYKDEVRGNCFVVALGGHGLLKFQILKDYRRVRLLDLIVL